MLSRGFRRDVFDGAMLLLHCWILRTPQGVKEEIIVDLVEQCRSLPKACHEVLCRHDDIAKGTSSASVVTNDTPVAPFDECGITRMKSQKMILFKLSRRSTRDTSQGQGLVTHIKSERSSGPSGSAPTAVSTHSNDSIPYQISPQKASSPPPDDLINPIRQPMMIFP
nr:TOM1-like protein 4 [Ipomoea batatas]